MSGVGDWVLKCGRKGIGDRGWGMFFWFGDRVFDVECVGMCSSTVACVRGFGGWELGVGCGVAERERVA